MHVVLVGEPTRGSTVDYPAQLRRLAQELKIEAYVHFRPFTQQTALAFASLDAFVMASVGETYGMVTIEAMAAGIPVVGTQSGGTPELLGNGAYGQLVPPQDEQALAQALEQLFDNPATGLERAQKAAVHVQQYSYQRQCEAIERILAGHPPS